MPLLWSRLLLGTHTRTHTSIHTHTHTQVWIQGTQWPSVVPQCLVPHTFLGSSLASFASCAPSVPIVCGLRILCGGGRPEHQRTDNHTRNQPPKGHQHIHSIAHQKGLHFSSSTYHPLPKHPASLRRLWASFLTFLPPFPLVREAVVSAPSFPQSFPSSTLYNRRWSHSPTEIINHQSPPRIGNDQRAHRRKKYDNATLLQQLSLLARQHAFCTLENTIQVNQWCCINRRKQYGSRNCKLKCQDSPWVPCEGLRHYLHPAESFSSDLSHRQPCQEQGHCDVLQYFAAAREDPPIPSPRGLAGIKTTNPKH